MTFAYIRTLGWAHQNDKAVLCHLLTLRDIDMFIPGGSLITGEVEYVGDVGLINFFWDFPEEVKDALTIALATNDKEEDRIRSEEDWTPCRLSYMPVSIHPVGKDYAYIVAFTEDDAKEAAYKAGLRVIKGHGHAGPGGDGEYHGSVWTRLVEHQKRQEQPVEA